MNTKNDYHSIGRNLNTNLLKLMNDNGVTLTILHKNTGIAIPTIKRLQSDPTANPTMTTLLPIAQFFGVTVNQLISEDLTENSSYGYIENKSHWKKVPLISWERVIDWQNTENKIESESYALIDVDVGNNPYAVVADEDDWVNIPKGSILIINSDLTPEHKDYTIIYKPGSLHPTLKQVLYDEGKVYLRSLDFILPPSLIVEKDYLYLGVLIQIRKNIKV